jgi:hypothetical protein
MVAAAGNRRAQHDTVYQANLGEESAAKAQAITRFAPDADAGWQVVAGDPSLMPHQG